MAHRFACGERETWKNIKKYQNIVKMTVGLSKLVISKTLMYEIWYDYIQPKYYQNANLCYIDTDSFIVYTKTKETYEEIPNNEEKRFLTHQIMKSNAIPL